MVLWLRVHTPNPGVLGSIPHQRTRYHLQLQKSKIPHAATKTQCSQITNKNKINIKKYIYHSPLTLWKGQLPSQANITDRTEPRKSLSLLQIFAYFSIPFNQEIIVKYSPRARTIPGPGDSLISKINTSLFRSRRSKKQLQDDVKCVLVKELQGSRRELNSLSSQS